MTRIAEIGAIERKWESGVGMGTSFRFWFLAVGLTVGAKRS